MTTDEIESSSAADHETAPVDVETISEITGQVLDLSLSTSTREDVLAHAATVHGFLNLLVREELDADRNPAVRALIGKAYALLAAKPPTAGTPCFSAYAHMREAADITRRLLRVWVVRNAEAGRNDGASARVSGAGL